jgi:hypothetical protein
VPGGTAPNRVRAARIEAATNVTEAREWLREHESAYAAVMRRPGNGYANEKEAP